MKLSLPLLIAAFCSTIQAYRYDPQWTQYNLNQNQTATDAIDYWGEWSGHQYTPSPSNWRFPFYTLFLDRFVNGDPTNDNTNNTAFEHDLNSNQMRHGGDLQGLIDTLDYLQGMGVKALYIAGSPFMNQPWGYDAYSPVDLSILDPHFGTIDAWRSAVDAIHERGMYVILDNTFATMGDLIGFEGYLNSTAPFLLAEHKVQWKTDREYYDFKVGNNYNKTCEYPRFWLETGYPVGEEVTNQMIGCYDSDFDQYGDTEAFGVFPDWRRQLSKFASVQDRLREWNEPVRNKIENFYCMMIAQLDIDGYRYDKATQSTVDAMGYMNDAMRQCARKHGKSNFFLPGEITGGNVFGSIFIGRGRQPDQLPDNLTQAVTMTNNSADRYFLRQQEYGGLDSGAFHYTVYRTLTRFLGMDGNLEAGYDSPPNWVDMWNNFLITNDLVNANTGKFDPRHMYGVTNQDVFRWPGIKNGTHRQLLGHFITTLTLPGIPLLLWGEEQAFYVFDNTATNYIFGRQAMSATTAWKTHGCYTFEKPSSQYFNMPVEAARTGCKDTNNLLDHRDPSHPIRNIIRHMYNLRTEFPVLNDGFFLMQLSNQSQDVFYPGSGTVPTETGLWSVMRSQFETVQDLSDSGGAGDLPVWLIYSNLNDTKAYQFDCSNNDTNLNTTALIAPYDSGTTVRNLFYPYDEQTLQDSPRTLGIRGSAKRNGCLKQLTMEAYGFRAYVPVDDWVGPKPMVTKFIPGHDARILVTTGVNQTQNLDVELQFTVEMDCTSVTNSLSFTSSVESGLVPSVSGTPQCSKIQNPDAPLYPGGLISAWSWKATLKDVTHGVHQLTFKQPATSSGASTNATDHFLLRVGAANNPMVFPLTANYSSTLLNQQGSTLYVSHTASGANKWRYSTNWGSTFSDWLDYQGGNSTIQKQAWSGTKQQAWSGEHIRVEYYSRLGGSSSHVQQGDLDNSQLERRFPHLFLNGPYNQYGYDAGLNNEITHTDDSTWEFHFMTEWQKRDTGTLAQINVWGINPDGKPDQSYVFGDADGDSVLDRLPPSSLSSVVLNITKPPDKPFLAWRFVIDDATLNFRLIPAGSMYPQIALYVLLWVMPIVLAATAVWLFMQSFYKVKFNKVGITEKATFIPMAIKSQFKRVRNNRGDDEPHLLSKFKTKSKFIQSSVAVNENRRRTVLIATMEYDIEDWSIKIKIGGLGVMAQLMGKNLGHQDLIWVVPCVGDVEYPTDTLGEPILVTILGKSYEVKVQFHVLRNITYVLLDAPVFRQQTKSEPYPPRMDDMSSAIYYSAWNQCIAQVINRFPIDLYHINDYHGSIAPLYLLPRTIPACLSLHNAEFQGLWPMRNKQEREEVCSVFNLPIKVAQQYVQFGEVFNLLHAGASYLRVQQQGFGAVGVSKKYGKRAYARYPIFWGLKKVGKLPNPDPSDTGEWDKKLPKEGDIHVDPAFESARPELKRQAQEWAGLKQDPKAELFVFVGRWSMQKGIDLIADIFPSILEAHPQVQLITVGPVIDLYGKFAALKLDRMMQVYPGRVCSKPVFTALPPFIFSGAEFALIPSRDEPFGLVAVEFGRKGALGVGARVGGLGQMPGWWFTVESMTTSHLLHQFRLAIAEALSSKTDTRAMMRARSAKQRFPVAQWVEDLEILQTTAIRIHNKVEATKRHSASEDMINNGVPAPPLDFGLGGEIAPPAEIASPSQPPSRVSSSGSLAVLGQRLRHLSHSPSTEKLPEQIATSRKPSGLSRQVSLGSRRGPGHARAAYVADRQAAGNTLPRVPDNPNTHSMVLPEEYDTDDSAEYSDEDDHVIPTGYLGRPPPDSPSQSNDRMYAGGRNRESSSPTADRMYSSSAFQSATDLTFQQQSTGYDMSPMLSPNVDSHLMPPPMAFQDGNKRISASPSLVSVNDIVGEKTDFKLQKVDPFFTDSTGAFYQSFSKKLEDLNGTNSETNTCIEEFLVKSEKKWFDSFRNAKLGRSSRRPSYSTSRGNSRAPSRMGETDHESESDFDTNEEFLLGKDYTPPTGMRKWMQLRVGDWPIYAIFMAFGQVIAANSYQITLLTGEIGQTATKLYWIATVYLVTSMLWWVMFRRFSSVVCLSLPFLFYGLAFVFIGCAHYGGSNGSTAIIQNFGTACYAIASSSGSIYFALNFGDEGGAQVKAWVFRACVIQGTQQIYVVALWYWGSVLSKASQAGLTTEVTFANSWKITALCLPLALLFWAVGVLMWLGLPNYYRQQPGAMPNFYQSLMRRKIVLWFFFTVVVQNFFLSAPYGRNWSFLFSSAHAATWQIILLVAVFFIGVWAGFLWIFGILSKSHSWILPLFAIGLGAPRWAQIWWGTSGIGSWLPWAGGFTSSALLSRALWLWLGVLDAIQGVGLGMILLGTLTRVHVAFTLITAQVLGSIATIVARACAPNKIGPGPISPDISSGISNIGQPWFWIGLIANLVVCIGYFMFYRKEQLAKP